MEMEQPHTDIYAIIEGLINFSQIQSHLNAILLPSHVKVTTNLKRKSALTVEKNGQECGRLGYYSNLAKGRGSLYLMTREEDPFCGKKFFFLFFCEKLRIGGKIQIFKKHVFHFYRNTIHG